MKTTVIGVFSTKMTKCAIHAHAVGRLYKHIVFDLSIQHCMNFKINIREIPVCMSGAHLHL